MGLGQSGFGLRQTWAKVGLSQGGFRPAWRRQGDFRQKRVWPVKTGNNKINIGENRKEQSEYRQKQEETK